MATKYARPTPSCSDRLFVAAIDFGTTYSGYAFSFRHDFIKDPSKINSNQTWIAGHKNLFSLKAPTCVLLKPDRTFDSFGYEAEDKYTELFQEDSHEDWYFFKRFKMTLHNNMNLRRDHMIPDITNKKEMPARDIFAHGIKFLKDHLMKHLHTKGIYEAIDDERYIHWVLTVPAIWNDSAKQFMREAAQKAGIKEHQLSIALEPEAAALFCRILPVEKLDTGSGKCLGMFSPGTEYMVLDLGGGTVDVTVQRVLEEGNLEEVFKASGGAWGGTKVDESFLQLLVEVVGTNVMKTFKENYPGDELELFREFETKKRTITNSCSNRVTLRMPIQLDEAYEEEFGTTLKETIKQTNFKGKMNWTGDKLRVDPEIIRNLFALSADSIVQHVRDLLKNEACRNVNTLLMVGGFSECVLIQDAIKSNLSDKRVIIPEEAGLAVVKGAVLFGHNPLTIISRKSKYTYGISITRNFKSGDPVEKRINVRGIDKCSTVFSKHVEVNQTVSVGEALETQTYRPLYADSTSVVVKIFTSDDENPRYTTDPLCNYLGKIDVPLSPGSDENTVIEVKMTFGDTELAVEACEENGRPLMATFDFLDH
ncbi:heat shock 70 kDa protein 12B-like [Mizuhopecten yessoensis]|uniref:Heat shock 70 kDa protein n=1 Tax=Mizuhopecten yessoensis TaxID=6573 RepID=A0A1C9U2Y3_MIZYE|nr:heat shock 70 kDa protein 12B-like [Mizuhopecten yessoensis]XP_021352066.1 heat shock 70 kDa protein 12B-like [Mizuhopecten yessoensis]AOR17349.1 heat shock 70 kDa protein [Mizuhopecten yessoensis]OWF51207.1 Heat shock 70 kDa protein 12B [Mizuhopecten yessoensis]